jgi:hypothetical protein
MEGKEYQKPVKDESRNERFYNNLFSNKIEVFCCFGTHYKIIQNCIKVLI